MAIGLALERPPGATHDEIAAIYEARFADFLRVARAITRDPDAGRDAVQEGFARALAARHSFRGDGPLEAWLWRSVVNAARTARSRDGREDALDAEPFWDGGFADPNAALRRAVAALPEKQRLAVFLRHYADLDYRGIAATLDIETNTVGPTLAAAHAALRRTLRGMR
jgi:RNA polymerase sigma-70 factor, ECF subfamily